MTLFVNPVITKLEVQMKQHLGDEKNIDLIIRINMLLFLFIILRGPITFCLRRLVNTLCS